MVKIIRILGCLTAWGHYTIEKMPLQAPNHPDLRNRRLGKNVSPEQGCGRIF